MKDITKKLVDLLRSGYCTPQIAKLAKKLKEPSSTIHYNIKKLENENVVKNYKAIFNHKFIGEGFCVFVLLNLSPEEYGDPDRIAKDLSKYDEIESINIITGDWEILLKVRLKDQEEYYNFIKNVISRKGITKIKSLTSLKEKKSEFYIID
ncbi:Lrp/AsnC family transcriptional regulator [Candidatus Woesearchaeota archaeon]|nr:Lrp/AsnC family transcriptional regulator [Candidatus Woesearchaeota archaeon]